MRAPAENVALAGDRASGDRITVGDIVDSIAAVGQGASVIVKNALSQADEAREQKQFEQEELALAVARLAESLEKRVLAPPRVDHNPYQNLLHYDLSDAGRFYGRQAICRKLLADMTCADSRGRLAVLHGEAGFGKTSLLRACVVPSLVAREHLPIYVQVTPSPLVTAVKQSLLPDLAPTPDLREASLQGFFRRVASILGPGKGIFILLDQFEQFFEALEPARQRFLHELARCLNDEDPCSRWLISVRSSRFGYLNTFQPLIRQPFANTTVLGPLARSDARQAIREPARSANLAIDDELCRTLLDDLGDNAIEPARLQIVCHTLVEALPPAQKQLTMEQYLAAGRAGSILRDYLDNVLDNNLPPQDRENAWRLLEAIVELSPGSATAAQLAAYLKANGISSAECGRLLALLVENRLVRQAGESYQLTSEKFYPRIRQWSAERAATEQARLETIRQLERVRDSALRGLLAGAVGFSLAFLITYAGQIDETNLLGYLTILRAVPGGLAGLLLILLIDVGLTSYRYHHHAMIWFVGALAGAASFALAFWFHALLRFRGGATLTAALQGALWGALCGLGIIWTINARRHLWLTAFIVATLCGLMLWLLQFVGHAFGEPDPAILTIPAGAVLALCLLAAALFPRWGKEETLDMD